MTGAYEPDFLRAHLKRFDGSIRAMEDYARSHPVYGDEIRKTDAELFRMLQVPYADPAEGARRRAELEAQRRALVVAAVEDEEPGARRGAKELGIPERELWWIIERRLENGARASRKWLAEETARRQDLDHVPRDRLSPLVDWIDTHREAAERAARLRKIPAEFRAGKLGRVPPRS